MGEHKYKIQLNKIDERNIAQALFKLIAEKAKIIINICEDNCGEIYKSDLKTIEIMQADINQFKSTLGILYDAEVSNNEQ